MKNSSLEKFKAMSPEQLAAQTPRALLAALEGSRARAACSCGSSACDGADPSVVDFNASQWKLGQDCKAALAGKPHVERSSKPAKKPEKKKLRY